MNHLYYYKILDVVMFVWHYLGPHRLTDLLPGWISYLFLQSLIWSSKRKIAKIKKAAFSRSLLNFNMEMIIKLEMSSNIFQFKGYNYVI